VRLRRRQFIGTTLTAGAAASTGAASGAPPRGSAPPPRTADPSTYSRLDAALARPVLDRAPFAAPVVIESLELLRYEGDFLCRVRSRDGASGLSIGHASLASLYPIFLNLLQPFFLGKDARDLDLLLERAYVYNLNFRLSGMALGVPLATIELAILDMLGRIAGRPMGALIGRIHHPRVAVYQATEYREKPVEESLDLIRRDVAEYRARALKIKVGGLMFMTRELRPVAPPGRTERMIPLVREAFGPDMALYADANGFYSVEEAIRVGRLLEEQRYLFFEEPVHFDWYEETKEVADALALDVAGGEQEYSLHGFRWLLANGGLQVVQPDTYYFGGMIRSTRVARMAEALGRSCTPHMSGGGLGFLYMLHFVSALPNACPHHEFKGLGTSVRFDCPTSPLAVVDGAITVPTGPGSGVELDPAWIARHRAVSA
jgi:L-alanine-DL-glutamate epimerase-like enolase superfamily enzyme